MSRRAPLVEFDKARIEDLLARLDARLRQRGVSASVYLVGGAAIALTVYDSRRTQDIDALVSDTAVLEEAAALAQEAGIPPGWLNDSAKPWIPTPPRAVRTRGKEPGLTIHVAPKEHLLAMKLVAMRRQDVPDVVALVTALHMESASASEFVEVLEAAYDGEDALQQVLGVPHEEVDQEARRRGEAAVKAIAKAHGASQS